MASFAATPSARASPPKSTPCRREKRTRGGQQAARMKSFKGKTLRWEWREGCIELTLDHEPANEIGTAMLEELEIFAGGFGTLAPETSACIISSARTSVFSSGGGLRELYHHAMSIPEG